MKIAIVVHGRFHAFDLARALLDCQHDVTLFTNYPAQTVERFGIARRHVRSFWLHGIATRVVFRLRDRIGVRVPEASLHQAFGRWAAAQLVRERWDVVHGWSGVSEEPIRALLGSGACYSLMRGSAHIRVQDNLLAQEEQRTGVSLERPSPWMIAREEREYTLADRIVVLSTFARDSFLSCGTDRERLSVLPLGARPDRFRPPAHVIEERCARILRGEPLNLLYTGNLLLRKGLWDLSEVARQLDPAHFRLRLVGSLSPEVSALLPALRRHAELIPRQPESALPEHYNWGDLFVFPTIEDGYAVVLAHAQAGALPILTTPNCSGPDLVQPERTGWILPIHDPQAYIERLRWCHANRPALAAMVRASYERFAPRNWSDVAEHVARIWAPRKVLSNAH